MTKTRTKAPTKWKWEKPATPLRVLTKNREGKPRETKPNSARIYGKSGLAIHEMTGEKNKGKFCVTHMQSGYSICKNFPTMKDAKKMTERIAPRMDWTQNKEACQKRGQEIGIAKLWRVR